MSYYRRGPFRPGGGYTIGVPPVTPYLKMIMIACAAIWFLQTVLYSLLQTDPLARWLGLVPALVVRGAVWQPVTYMFLHAGMMHVLFNMLILWMFGSELERHWGSRAFLRYYLVSGVAGGLFSVFAGWFGNPNIPTVGASGAIYGVITAYGILFAERTVLFMMIFPMKARTLAILMFAMALLNSLNQPGSGIAHIAHLGGAVGGFLYLKRAWRVGNIYREWKWRRQRKKFSVMSSDRDDHDRWVN